MQELVVVVSDDLGELVFECGEGIEDTETFQLLRSRLVKEGATDGTLTDFGAVRTVWFTDPDGMGCEIAMWSPGTPRAFEDRTQEAYASAH